MTAQGHSRRFGVRPATPDHPDQLTSQRPRNDTPRHLFVEPTDLSSLSAACAQGDGDEFLAMVGRHANEI
jgi:hypothetical protein